MQCSFLTVGERGRCERCSSGALFRVITGEHVSNVCSVHAETINGGWIDVTGTSRVAQQRAPSPPKRSKAEKAEERRDDRRARRVIRGVIPFVDLIDEVLGNSRRDSEW